jgi:PAS domain S-box-containing protein
MAIVEDNERALFASIELSPMATVITNPRLGDNPIVAVNRAFCTLTGYARDEVVGRNCRFLAGPDTEDLARAVLREAITAARPALTEMLNYRRDGTRFRNAVMISPVFGPTGELAYFLGSQMEVVEGAQPSSTLRRQRAQQLVSKLTLRQRQVLNQMVRGRRNKQIAPSLGISEKTVKMHRAALLAKLGVASSADAVRIAVEAEL